MPQIVMSEMMQPKLFARVLKRAVELSHDANRGIQKGFFTPLLLEALKQCSHFRNHRDATYLPILGSGFRVTANDDFTFGKIAVASENMPGFIQRGPAYAKN